MTNSANSHIARRREISKKYLVGQGIELGALHNPLWTGPRAKVRYVDRLDVPGLRKHYPELKSFELVPVDVIDDGEKLNTIEDESLDFIIANHMLEHTENPIGTIRNHLRKVRDGGVLYYAVPDKRFTFDVVRQMTSFEHLVRDDCEGPEISRRQHFLEWASLVDKNPPHLWEEIASNLMRMNYSIHYHVWDCSHFESFLHQVSEYLHHPFTIEHFGQNHEEILAILTKGRRKHRFLPRIGRWLGRRAS